MIRWLWIIRVRQDNSLIARHPLAIVHVLNQIDITVVGRVIGQALTQQGNHAVNAGLKLYGVITESMVLNDRGIDADL